MVNSREKGRQGEKQVIAICDEFLGVHLHRNLMQTAQGGFDLEGLETWAPEVKFYKTATYKQRQSWWNQAVDQCPKDREPCVWFKSNQQPWQVMYWPRSREPFFPLYDWRGVITVHPEYWCAIVREEL